MKTTKAITRKQLRRRTGDMAKFIIVISQVSHNHTFTHDLVKDSKVIPYHNRDKYCQTTYQIFKSRKSHEREPNKNVTTDLTD